MGCCVESALGKEEAVVDEKEVREFIPTAPDYATPQERAIMERFLRVIGGNGGYICGLVETSCPDIQFNESHPTREDAEFCCYMLAKAIAFCGQATTHLR